jgi:DNA ligase-associated metallophosphoesterase
MADLEITMAGERVLLLPEHALYWPAQATLLIADPHLGKAATFRAAAIPVPESGTDDDLARLDQAILRSGAERLIVLGDLTHARAGFAPPVVAAIAAWRARHGALSFMLVRGNHDLRAGDPPAAWGFAPVDEPFALGPFVLGHHPDLATPGYLIAGHVHPAVRLKGRGGQRLRLPCFMVGARRAILPAFGGFTGAATIQPHEDDQVYVIADGEVLAVR